jgi:peptidoglycan/xylan/chitin deacetylase (PgdA/CDA1 family)
VARELGLKPVMWNVSCYDWKAKSAEEIVGHAARQIRSGGVILLHDGGHLRMGIDRSCTIEATERLIARYQGDGFQFITIPEMMSRAATEQVGALTTG